MPLFDVRGRSERKRMFERTKEAISFAGAILNGIATRHIGLIAAGIAFYSLLAIFPGITALVTLWGYFADPEIVEQQLAGYEPLLPAAVFNIIAGQVHAIADGPKEVLGWASLLTTGVAIWLTRIGVSAMIGGLNAVYEVPPRGGLRSQAVALFLTLLLILVALVSMAVVVVVPVILSHLPLGAFSDLALRVLLFVIGTGVVLLGVGILYRLGPNLPGRKRPLFTTGAILAVVLWMIVSRGFALYLTNFGRYNEIYGSLGAVVALLMWFYLSAYVVLLGALVDAELAKRRAARKLAMEAEAHSRIADEDDDIAPPAERPAAPVPASGVTTGGGAFDDPPGIPSPG
ncbi:YihY/virulence factor BrkB family protein [Tropicimonas sp.]|uniref:YihY/virulence factor BrkB family protein n=1 Tax=Tropicimonas sp. TaxID=2067044 RepID=UPI003A891453